jgi:hypothetical protein
MSSTIYLFSFITYIRHQFRVSPHDVEGTGPRTEHKGPIRRHIEDFGQLWKRVFLREVWKRVQIRRSADICYLFIAAQPGRCEVEGRLLEIGTGDDGSGDILEVKGKTFGKEGSEL